MMVRPAILLLALGALGCRFDYSVVRVHEGRSREGRFVEPEAYSKSLEAALAAERGDYATALAALEGAREADPDDADLVARIGAALCRLDRDREANKAFEDALKIDPESERTFLERATCRLRVKQPDLAAVRADLQRALTCNPESIEAALLLAELDLRNGKLALARARVEETVVLHPTVASAWRTLAEIAATQGELTRATEAALRARRYDGNEGKKAIAIVLPMVEEAGLAQAALLLRGKRPEPESSLPENPGCIVRLRALEKIAAHGDHTTISIAAEGVRAACPETDEAATQLELASTWSPTSADEVEARASTSPNARTRRWGARMRLRRTALEKLEEQDALPRAEDRETLALHLAAQALVRTKKNPKDASAIALARAAHDLAPAEPTVTRMVAEAMRRTGSDTYRVTACALARTAIEKSSCTS